MSQGSSTSASPIYSKANTPPQKSPHPSDSFQRERIQRYYASPEESDDPIPIFTTPTNMYIREELNPRPRFTSPRPRNSHTAHRSQFDPLANKYQTNNHIPQKTNTSPKDFDINGRPKATSSSTGDKLNKDIPKAGKTFVNSAQASQKDEILAQLVDMGFNLKDAGIALAATNSTNLQDVLDFLIQNTNSNDQQVPEAADSSDDEDPSIERAKEEAWRCEQEERRKEYLDQLKKVNTEKERKQGNFYFNQGKFTDAEKSYSIAISSLPADHKDLVLLYNNRAAARLKLGQFVACLDDCSLAIGLASKNTELKADLTEGVSSWKSQWLKALHRKACALEGLKMYEIAIQVYEDYARLDGVRNSIVTQGILRCQQAAQPQQQQSTNGPAWKASKDTTTAFPDIDFSIFVPKKSNVNMDEINASKAVREMREREKKKEAEDAERLEKEDKVNAHLTAWKSGKEKNLRALLSSLEQILWTGIEWKGVTMTELLEPRKCKITYMKAIAKVHPDKLSSKATVEQRLLASEIIKRLFFFIIFFFYMSPLTINTQDFSDPEFNPKKWINSVLKPTQENSEEDETKETTVLVTKLQMASEDASRQFEQLSNSIIKSMPRVSYDLKQISENARVIQHKILSAQQKLTLLQRDTGGALEQLRRPHTVKTRMEKCQVLFDELKQDKENKTTNEQGKEREIVKEEQEKGEKDLSLSVDPATLLDLENPLQIHPNTESLRSNSQENTPQANNVLKKIGVPVRGF